MGAAVPHEAVSDASRTRGANRTSGVIMNNNEGGGLALRSLMEGDGWVDWPGLATLLAEAAGWVGAPLANWKPWSPSQSPSREALATQQAGSGRLGKTVSGGPRITQELAT